MKFLRAKYIPSGSPSCESCATLQKGPCEMYTYIDLRGQIMDVCFGCRMFCTEDRTVASFKERQGAPLK